MTWRNGERYGLRPTTRIGTKKCTQVAERVLRQWQTMRGDCVISSVHALSSVEGTGGDVLARTFQITSLNLFTLTALIACLCSFGYILGTRSRLQQQLLFERSAHTRLDASFASGCYDIECVLRSDPADANLYTFVIKTGEHMSWHGGSMTKKPSTIRIGPHKLIHIPLSSHWL